MSLCLNILWAVLV